MVQQVLLISPETHMVEQVMLWGDDPYPPTWIGFITHAYVEGVWIGWMWVPSMDTFIAPPVSDDSL